METLILISSIIMTLITLIKVHRFNHNLAKYMSTETNVYLGGQPLYLMNTAGKWLTFAGGITTAPLVMALIFSPEGSPHWIITTGVMGLATLLAAILVLAFVFVKHCLKRKLIIKRVVSSVFHHFLNKIKMLNWIKVALWLGGITLLIVFLPFFIEFANFLVYLIGFLMAARLGLLEKLGDKEEDNSDDFYRHYNDFDNDDYYYNP